VKCVILLRAYLAHKEHLVYQAKKALRDSEEEMEILEPMERLAIL